MVLSDSSRWGVNGTCLFGECVVKRWRFVYGYSLFRNFSMLGDISNYYNKKRNMNSKLNHKHNMNRNIKRKQLLIGEGYFA
jgi:hypothetical protein